VKAMIEKIIRQVEEKILPGIGERLEIETELIKDKGRVYLVTTSYWDGYEVSNNEFDLEPLIDEIVARLK